MPFAMAAGVKQLPEKHPAEQVVLDLDGAERRAVMASAGGWP